MPKAAKKTSTLAGLFKVRAELRKAAQSKKDALLGYSKSSSDASEIVNVDPIKFQQPEGKQELEILYRNSWAIRKSITVRANLLTFRGLKIVTKSDKARKVVNEMLKKMHPTRPMLALQGSFHSRSINTDIWGNGFDELLYEPRGTKEKPASIKDAKSLNGFTDL